MWLYQVYITFRVDDTLNSLSTSGREQGNNSSVWSPGWEYFGAVLGLLEEWSVILGEILVNAHFRTLQSTPFGDDELSCAIWNEFHDDRARLRLVVPRASPLRSVWDFIFAQRSNAMWSFNVILCDWNFQDLVHNTTHVIVCVFAVGLRDAIESQTNLKLT